MAIPPRDQKKCQAPCSTHPVLYEGNTHRYGHARMAGSEITKNWFLVSFPSPGNILGLE